MVQIRHKRIFTSKKSATVYVICWQPSYDIIKVDNLQKAGYKLNQIIAEHDLTISVQKSKLMVFKWGDQLEVKL
jgi:hypothetical protein